MNNRRVLLFKKDDLADELCYFIQSREWDVLVANTVANAQALLARHDIYVGLLLIDRENDQAFLKQIEELICFYPAINWIIILPQICMQETDTYSFEQKLITEFCYDYHTLPIDEERLLFALGHANGMAEMMCKSIKPFNGFPGKYQLVGTCPAMVKVFNQITDFSREDCMVMISGEKGVGKKTVAKAIHEHSIRSRKPFVAVNCNNLSGGKGRAALFGYEKVANVDNKKNIKQKIGIMESAQGGTLFLDGIENLTPDWQKYLVRFIREKAITRMDGTNKMPLDFRLIVSSESDLTDEVAKEAFRSDLFFYLRMKRIEIPPLRSREDDIELLALYFFQKFTKLQRSKIKGFRPDALRMLRQYDWPKNVDELQTRIHRALVLSDSRLLTPKDLALERRSDNRHLSTLEESRAQADQKAIISTLRHTNYNISKSAKILNISRVALYGLIDKYNLKNIISSG